MSGIFASQFSYGDPYNPMGLTPGTMEVGGRAPTRKPKPPKEDVPSRQPVENPPASNTAAESAAMAQSLATGMGIGASNFGLQGAGASSPVGMSNQNKFSQMIDAPASAPQRGFGGGHFERSVGPVPQEHTVSSPSWWQTAAHNLGTVMSVGDPFAGQPFDRGIMGLVNPQQYSSVSAPSDTGSAVRGATDMHPDFLSTVGRDAATIGEDALSAIGL